MKIFETIKDFFDKGAEYDYLFLRSLPTEEYPYYLKKIFKARTGLRLNLEKPRRFIEKIQWLKLYDDFEGKTHLADKITVRDFFVETLQKAGYENPSKYLKELIGTYKTFEEIDFSKLPNEFFIQTNHAAKMLLKVKNKEKFLESGYKHAKKQFNDWLGYNFAFCAGFECQYKNIEPKIIIEKLYKNSDETPIKDCMFFCFNGEPKIAQSVLLSDNQKYAFYDLDWNLIPCYQGKVLSATSVEKPYNLDKMIEISRIIAQQFKFVRVDFIEVEKELYFLELTFTPNSGMLRFYPDKYDFIFGDLLKL